MNVNSIFSLLFAILLYSCYTSYMIHLEPKNYPKDFYYHRTASATYREYLHSCGLTTFDIDHAPQFAWKKKIFGNWFWVVKYERIDIEPDIEHIKRVTWLRHAFIAWIPYSLTDIPKPWRRLWMTDHFEETGYAQLVENGNTWTSESNPLSHLSSWNDRSKRAYKKYLASGATIKYVTPEEYTSAFQKTKVKHWYKWAYISYYNRMVKIDASKIRQWLAYAPDGQIVWGLSVHDFCENHSVHLTAFTDVRYYDLQAGTGLIERWFHDSYEKWYTYLSFDQLRNKNGPSDQKGYTAFKENFLTARLSFKKAFFRFF